MSKYFTKGITFFEIMNVLNVSNGTLFTPATHPKYCRHYNCCTYKYIMHFLFKRYVSYEIMLGMEHVTSTL